MSRSFIQSRKRFQELFQSLEKVRVAALIPLADQEEPHPNRLEYVIHLYSYSLFTFYIFSPRKARGEDGEKRLEKSAALEEGLG